MLFLHLLGCIDYGVEGEKPEPAFSDSGLPDTDPPDTDTDDTALPGEECNGLDDDGDGVVDEGFGDIDGDGTADCEDACALTAAPGFAVTQGERCIPGFTPPGDVGDVVVEWAWAGLTTDPDADALWAAPVVANLTDDDGDGDIDGDDDPDIAFTACEWVPGAIPSCAVAGPVVSYVGTLVILDGRTGHVHLEQDGYDVLGPLAAADVDADGVPEVLAWASDGGLEGVQADGTVSWASASIAASAPWAGCVNVADLDADGNAEVITQNGVWSAGSGTSEAWVTSYAATAGMARSCPVTDLDRDGDQEWFPGAVITSGSGRAGPALATWTEFSNQDSQWVVPVQADADETGEVVVVTQGEVRLLEHDGTPVWALPITDDPLYTAGPPCVGDFDGDGAPELGLAWGASLRVLDLDGTELWTSDIYDGSGNAGCSGFDADGDGALELFYADEGSVRMHHGATGEELWRSDERNSGTGADYPVPADVDGDGSAELLVTNNPDLGRGGWEGLVVLGHASSGWAPAGPTWSNHDFAVTNLADDGSVPAAPTPGWADPMVWRARPAAPPAPDLSVSIVDVCVASCDVEATMQVAVQVSNRGWAAANVPVSLYRDDGGPLTLLATATVTVPAGYAADALVFDVSRADTLGLGLVAVVDDDGTGVGIAEECDESDNTDRWDDDPC